MIEAGRALDTIIAERVMGWKTFAGEPGQGRPPERPLSLILEEIPHYSTDIVAAWLVAERFGDYKIYRIGTQCGAALACVVSASGAEYEWLGEVSGITTVPLAICLAALKVIGVEVP